MAGFPQASSGSRDVEDLDQHSELFGHGSAYQPLDAAYHSTALGSERRFAEHQNIRRPNTPATSHFYRLGPPEPKQPYEKPTHPPGRGAHAPQPPANFLRPSQRPPNQAFQAYPVDSQHPAFAPGDIPWAVKEQMVNVSSAIQPPPAAQRPYQPGYGRNPRGLRIMTPPAAESLPRHPYKSSELLGVQDPYSSLGHPQTNYRLSDTYQEHLLPRGTATDPVDPSMSYSYPYSPSYYYHHHHHGRPAYPAGVPNSPYAYYSPYQRTSPLSPQYLPSSYYPLPSPAPTTPQTKLIINDDEDFYFPIVGIYRLADEPDLDRLLTQKTDSILTADPFSNKIPVDFGYGPLASLADYKIDKTTLKYYDAFNLDDLYLFEMALRLDELLTHKERLRRWDQRLNWENADDKAQLWNKMRDIERFRIGIGLGSWWAYQLFGICFDPTYGYYRHLLGPGGILTTRCVDFRKGTFKAHYPLSGRLKERFPVWRDGGLGLGRCLLAWVDDRPAPRRPAPGGTADDIKAEVAQEIYNQKVERLNRQFRMQCNISNMINTIRQKTSIAHPRPTPQSSYTFPGYQQHPSYLHPSASVAARFGHPVRRNIYEPAGEKSPGIFHHGIAPQAAGYYQHPPSNPHPLNRSESLPSRTVRPENYGLHPKDHPGGAAERLRPNPPVAPGPSREQPAQNPSHPQSTSEPQPKEAAFTELRRSPLHQTEQTTTIQDPPSNDSSSNIHRARPASESLPEPPQLYTPQSLPYPKRLE